MLNHISINVHFQINANWVSNIINLSNLKHCFQYWLDWMITTSVQSHKSLTRQMQLNVVSASTYVSQSLRPVYTQQCSTTAQAESTISSAPCFCTNETCKLVCKCWSCVCSKYRSYRCPPKSIRAPRKRRQSEIAWGRWFLGTDRLFASSCSCDFESTLCIYHLLSVRSRRGPAGVLLQTLTSKASAFRWAQETRRTTPSWFIRLQISGSVHSMGRSIGIQSTKCSIWFRVQTV